MLTRYSSKGIGTKQKQDKTMLSAAEIVVECTKQVVTNGHIDRKRRSGHYP